MIQVLLKGKLEKEFVRDPFEIEDLLTSVVLGSCEYLPSDRVLLPFLSRARLCDGGARPGPALGEKLRGVEGVEYEFWPWWRVQSDEAASGSDGEDGHEEADEPSDGDASTSRHWCQPELALRVKDQGGRKAWLLVEVKLHMGKSSRPSLEPTRVDDQLGKYWLALKREAEADGAEALGVVYLTAHNICPFADFRETLDELEKKGRKAAEEVVPLYWLSWRHFLDAVPDPCGSLPLLRDVRRLVRDYWQLVNVEMASWPSAIPSGSPWTFSAAASWRWLSWNGQETWKISDFVWPKWTAGQPWTFTTEM